MLILPPYMLIVPAMLVALPIVISAAFPLLPIVKPPNVLPKRQPLVLKALVKEVPADWIVSVPEPSKLLVAVVGASFCSTKLPALMVVAPV